MRLKKRYFVVKVNDDISKEEFEVALKETFKKLFGFINFSFSGLKLIYFDSEKKIAIIRCFHLYKEKLHSCLFLLSNNKNIQVFSLFVTSSLKKIKKRLNILKI